MFQPHLKQNHYSQIASFPELRVNNINLNKTPFLTSAFENFFFATTCTASYCFHSLPSIHCGSMPLPKATACIPAMTPSTKAWKGQIAPTLTPRGCFPCSVKNRMYRYQKVEIARSYVILCLHVSTSLHVMSIDAVRVLSLPSV